MELEEVCDAMCQKYDCLELNPALCDSDDAKYGNLHKNLKWARTGTIGNGASCCDFRIIDTARCPEHGAEPEGSL